MIEVYAKRQRAKRKDPQQEAIVTEKDKLNERTTKLIALMKAMKSGWNGGPSPDIGVDKFNLTQPMPDSVVGSGATALHELSDVVQTLNQIKAMQDAYAEARTQRLEKMRQIQPAAAPTTPQPAAPADNAQQQIASAVEEELLKKTASNPFTRVWTHITAYNPFVSEENRGERLALLRSLARMNDGLKKIEEHVLSTGEPSILDAIYVAREVYIDAKSSFFGSFRKGVDSVLEYTNSQLEDMKKGTGKIDGELDGKTTKNDIGVDQDIQAKINAVQGTIAEPVVTTQEEDTTTPNHLPVDAEIIPKDDKEEIPSIPAPPPPPRPEKKKREGRKRRAPIIPQSAAPESILADPDYESEQQAIAKRYQAAAEYVYGSVSSLQRECEKIVVKNFQGIWREEINKTYSIIYSLGSQISTQLVNGDDYEANYARFLQYVGYLKSIEYVATVEASAKQTDPELQTGEMFDGNELKNQASRFAELEFTKYYQAVSAKVAQASDMSRFFKRMLTYIIPRRDKNLRLMISRSARQARQGLQGMMDVLEDRHLNFRRLASNSELFFDSLRAVYEGLADIADMYNSAMRIEKSHRKQRGVKMTYDLIPTMDINALRMMQNYLERDVINLQKLQDVENSILEFAKAENSRGDNE